VANFSSDRVKSNRLGGARCGHRLLTERFEFPDVFLVADNSIMEKRATTQQVALASGQTLDLTGCSTSATNQIRLAAFQSLVTMSTGVRLARVRQQRNGR
jgi:hypothetical protein